MFILFIIYLYLMETIVLCLEYKSMLTQHKYRKWAIIINNYMIVIMIEFVLNSGV